MYKSVQCKYILMWIQFKSLLVNCYEVFGMCCCKMGMTQVNSLWYIYQDMIYQVFSAVTSLADQDSLLALTRSASVVQGCSEKKSCFSELHLCLFVFNFVASLACVIAS